MDIATHEKTELVEIKIEEKVDEVKTEEVVETKPEEVVETKTEEVVIKEEDLDFVSLLEFLINTGVLKSKYNIKIDKVTSDIILEIIKSNPQCFKDIENLVIEILKDKKLSVDDMPNVIILITKLYHVISSSDKEFTVDKLLNLCSTIIKTTIHILIIKNVIHLNGLNKNEIETSFNLIIDSSIHLIKLNNTLNSHLNTVLAPKSCFPFLKKN